MSMLLFALRCMNLGDDPLIEREKVSEEGGSRFFATLAVLLTGSFLCRYAASLV